MLVFVVSVVIGDIVVTAVSRQELSWFLILLLASGDQTAAPLPTLDHMRSLSPGLEE